MELAADSAILAPIKVWAACHFPTLWDLKLKLYNLKTVGNIRWYNNEHQYPLISKCPSIRSAILQAPHTLFLIYPHNITILVLHKAHCMHCTCQITIIIECRLSHQGKEKLGLGTRLDQGQVRIEKLK